MSWFDTSQGQWLRGSGSPKKLAPNGCFSGTHPVIIIPFDVQKIPIIRCFIFHIFPSQHDGGLNGLVKKDNLQRKHLKTHRKNGNIYGFLWLPMASCFDFTKVRSSVDPSRSSGSPHATPLRGSPLQKLEVCYWASPSGIPWNTHKMP